MTASTTRERRLPFEGAINFRDLGGYPAAQGRRVAWGRVYRSDSLSQMSEADLAAFDNLGLRTVCDLRSESERSRWPNRLPAAVSPRTIAIGFMPQGSEDTWGAINRGEMTPDAVAQHMRRHYVAFAGAHAGNFAALFDALLEPGALPALLHCASGKDRTGFGVAAILLALGVSREAILADYLISDRHRRDLRHLIGEAADPLAYEAVATADASYLAAAFEHIDLCWGGEDRYLREALRLSDERRQQLQALLLEDA